MSLYNSEKRFDRTKIVYVPAKSIAKASIITKERKPEREQGQVLVGSSSNSHSINFIAGHEGIENSEKTVDGENSHQQSLSNDFMQCSLSSTNSENETLQPSEITSMQIIHAEVTHIESPECFYVQKILDYPKLEVIFTAVNKAALMAKTATITEISTGALFLGKFTEDGNYYRAQVKRIDEKGIFVKYIDYGNSEYLVVSRLKQCPPSFSLDFVPAFEISCALWSIQPTNGSWSDDAICLFKDLVMGRKLNICILNIGPSRKCFINILRTSTIQYYAGLCVAEVLIFFNYAEAVGDSSPHQAEQPVSWNRSYLSPDMTFKEDLVDVTVCEVLSPSEFYLQLKRTETSFNKEMVYIQSHYNTPSIATSTDWFIYLPRPDVLCVMKCKEDSRWYRAKIVSAENPFEVTVFMVDTGKSEICTYEELRKIDEKFINCPQQAIRCKLIGILPNSGNWSDYSVKLFRKSVKKKLKAIFHGKNDNVYEVSLRIFDGEEDDVSQILVDNKCGFNLQKKADPNFARRSLELLNIDTLADSTFATSRRNISFYGRQRRKLDKQLYEETIQMTPINKDAQGVRHLVHFLGLLNPSAIFVRFKSQADTYIQIQSGLEVIDAQALKINYFPRVGDICLAIGPNKSKARGKVLQVDPNSATVFLMDNGGVRSYPLTAIHPLKKELASYRPLATVVSLAHVKPTCGRTEWSLTATDFAKEVLSTNCGFYIIRKGKFYRDRSVHNMKILPVELGWICVSNCDPYNEPIETHSSLNDLISQMGFALPDKNTKENEYDDDSSVVSKTKRRQRKGDLPPRRRRVRISEEGSGEGSSSNIRDDAIYDAESSDEEGDDSDDNGTAESDAVHLLNPRDKERVTMLGERGKSPINPERRGWKAPLPLTESVFLARPTNVHMDASLSLYLIKDSEVRLKEMSTIHEYQFGTSESSNDDLCWDVGDPIVAKYHQDGLWYRAIALGVQVNRKVKVNFVDYGNSDTLSVKDVRTSVSTTLHIPIQSYRCVLGDVVLESGKKWRLEDLDFLHKLIVDKVCRVTLLQPYKDGIRTKVKLELFDTGTDVSSVLVETKMCKYSAVFVPVVPAPVAAPESSSADVVVEEIESSSSLNGSLPNEAAAAATATTTAFQLPQYPLPKTSELIPVVITAIESPSLVSIAPTPLADNHNRTQSQTHKTIETTFKCHSKMMQLIQDGLHIRAILFHPEVDTLCLAYVSEKWHRGLILETNKATSTVLLIDFGMNENVENFWLRDAPPECFEVPAMSLFVEIKGITPPGGGAWSDAAKEKMADCLSESDRQYYASIVEGAGGGGGGEVPVVKLYVEDSLGISALSAKHFNSSIRNIICFQ